MTVDHKEIQQRWDEIRSRVRKRWPQLDNQDLSMIDGDSRKLIALVHQKTGADISEIEEGIDEIAAHSEGLLERVSRTAREYTTAASQSVSSATKQVTTPVTQAYQQVHHQMVDSPGRSAGVAFVIGLLIGMGTGSIVGDIRARRQQRSWWRG